MSGLAESKSAGFGFEGAIRLARAFLQKPFTQKILLKSVHELLKSLPKP
jgi:hypothetical protein